MRRAQAIHNLAEATQQLKTMTQEEKRKDIVTRIHAAQMLRQKQAAASDAPSAGLPAGDLLGSGKGAGGVAGLLVNAAPATAGRWGRTMAKNTPKPAGAEADQLPPRRDTLTTEADEPAAAGAKPDVEEALQSFSATESRTEMLPGQARGGLLADGVKADAALPMTDAEEPEEDKPASAGSAATPATLERAGVAPTGRRIGSAAAQDAAASADPSAPWPALDTSTKRANWAAQKAALMADHGAPLARPPGSSSSPPPSPPPPVPPPASATLGSLGSLRRSAVDPVANPPVPPGMLGMRTGSLPRHSVNGIGSGNATPDAVPGSPMRLMLGRSGVTEDAPARYSWTGAASDAETLGRSLTVNRQVRAAGLGRVRGLRARRCACLVVGRVC